jgi:uncharacterized protein involved in cysteine biosynthesis
MDIISQIISTLVQCLVGWILIEKVPDWLKISGFFATIIKIIGILVILRALISWV